MIYKERLGLTPDGTIYDNRESGFVEALLPAGGYETAHAPSLLELEEGDMLCAWFAGSFEGSGDVSIVCSRLKNGAKKWEEPCQVSRDMHRSEQNPSLFLGPDKNVWVVYTSQQERVPGKDNMQFTSEIRCQRSADGGISWGNYEVMFGQPGSFCRQPIQILTNGRWIFGNWLCSDSESGLAGNPTVFRISDDEGKTWRMVEMPESSGYVHANVIELEAGRLTAFMRSRAADFIYQSESADNGDTWTVPVPTILPNNNSSISALKLRSGRIALAYNPTCAPDAKPGTVSWPGLRCPVAVALSEDGGMTWPFIRYMEQGEGFAGAENRTNNKQYEYPYLMQGRDERLHLVYAYKNRVCIKYMAFTEKDVIGEKRERIGFYNPTSGRNQ
ncbi:MAG: exo-alpha-sialidase [Hungatella hathewayi]|mgnify:CR=1 FL=1|nr:exo-alpha-sialidase [Hungatella hathewayi]